MYLGFFGLFGLGLSKRTRKFLVLFLVIAATGTIIYACSNSNDDTPTAEAALSAVVPQTLESNTTYYWRVTANGQNTHVMSDSSFKTAP